MFNSEQFSDSYDTSLGAGKSLPKASTRVAKVRPSPESSSFRKLSSD